MATLLEDVGTNTLSHLDYVGSLNIQWWATLRAMGSALPFVGNRYRWKESVHQMLQIGVGAFPMVALMAICSGFILALQGASELRRFGALHFVIDLVAVGFTRELGALLTAIAVSGRSGSAFAAEIGTMKVTEIILRFLDALEKDRGNTVVSRNLRLTAIRSFYRMCRIARSCERRHRNPRAGDPTKASQYPSAPVFDTGRDGGHLGFHRPYTLVRAA